eukprot:2389021-Alexandrium_andersonii.AAC.1
MCIRDRDSSGQLRRAPGEPPASLREARRGAERRGEARRGAQRRAEAWRGPERRGEAQRGTERRGE